MPHRTTVLLGGLVLLLAIACVQGAPRERDPLAQAGPAPAAAGSSARVMVTPLNLAVAPPEDLADAAPPVEAELLRALAARGLRVTVIDAGDAWTLWRSAVAPLPQRGTPVQRLEAAVRAFARSLRDAGADFDHLLLPALAYRSARVDGRVAHWDGVERRLRVEVRNAVDAPAFEPDWREVPGLSLHVTLADAEGRIVYRRWGGLDLVQSALIDGNAGDRPALILRRDILQDPALVREGVDVALEGYPGSPGPAPSR